MAKLVCINLNQECQLNSDENLLDAFEKVHVDLPQGCRSGSCGVCVIEVIKGEQELVPANQVERNTLERLYSKHLLKKTPLRLACRSQLKKDSTSSETIIIKSNLINL